MVRTVQVCKWNEIWVRLLFFPNVRGMLFFWSVGKLQVRYREELPRLAVWEKEKRGESGCWLDDSFLLLEVLKMAKASLSLGCAGPGESPTSASSTWH